MRFLLILPTLLLCVGCGDPYTHVNYKHIVAFNNRKIEECKKMGGYPQTRLIAYDGFPTAGFALYEEMQRCWFPGEK